MLAEVLRQDGRKSESGPAAQGGTEGRIRIMKIFVAVVALVTVFVLGVAPQASAQTQEGTLLEGTWKLVMRKLAPSSGTLVEVAFLAASESSAPRSRSRPRSRRSWAASSRCRQ